MIESRADKWVNTVTAPPNDVLRILILEKRENVIDSIEAFNRFKYQNQPTEDYEVRTRLNSLFLEIQASLKEDMKQNDGSFEALRSLLYSANKISQLLEVFYTINEWLYAKKLTQWDFKKDFKPKNIIEYNNQYGID